MSSARTRALRSSLRPYQLCNLTEVVVRASDDVASLARKVKLATILGTWQSTLTNFKYVRKVWSNNTEEERLLGVSLTGIMDNEILSGRSAQYGMNINHILASLRDVAVMTNLRCCREAGHRAFDGYHCM